MVVSRAYIIFSVASLFLSSGSSYGGAAAFAFALRSVPVINRGVNGQQLSLLDRRGGGLRVSSTAKVEDGDENEAVTRQEALSAMTKCYQVTFAAAAVDAITRFAPEVKGGWKVMIASRASSGWLDIFDATASMNLVVFGLGLWWVTKLYDKMGAPKSTEAAVDMSIVTEIMQSYRFMYLATGWSLVGLSMRLASKVFNSSDHIAPFLVLAFAIGASFYVNTNLFASEADALNSAKEPNEAMMNGIEAARNMKFCAISFVVFAALRFAFWFSVIITSDLAVVIKIIQVNKFLMPIALAKLLNSLDRQFLDATIEVTKADKEQDVNVFKGLKATEKSFYSKVAKVLRTSMILDIVRYSIPLIMGMVKGTVE
jgi:hypothetical protein